MTLSNICDCRHIAKTCPVPEFGSYEHGILMYTPPTIKAASASEMPPDVNDLNQVEPVITALKKDVEMSRSRGAYITFRDQDDNAWVVPLRAFDISVDTLGNNGRVHISGSAPLEYSSYPEADFEKKASETPKGAATGGDAVKPAINSA